MDHPGRANLATYVIGVPLLLGGLFLVIVSFGTVLIPFAVAGVVRYVRRRPTRERLCKTILCCEDLLRYSMTARAVRSLDPSRLFDLNVFVHRPRSSLLTSLICRRSDSIDGKFVVNVERFSWLPSYASATLGAKPIVIEWEKVAGIAFFHNEQPDTPMTSIELWTRSGEFIAFTDLTSTLDYLETALRGGEYPVKIIEAVPTGDSGSAYREPAAPLFKSPPATLTVGRSSSLTLDSFHDLTINGRTYASWTTLRTQLFASQ